ncbi:MAG: hypothetical protein R3A10_18645 [Caldilineaceae bacterium]
MRVYGRRTGGAHRVRIQDGSGAAVQWSLLHPTADELWVITLAALPADIAQQTQNLEAWLAEFDPAVAP